MSLSNGPPSLTFSCILDLTSMNQRKFVYERCGKYLWIGLANKIFVNSKRKYILVALYDFSSVSESEKFVEMALQDTQPYPSYCTSYLYKIHVQVSSKYKIITFHYYVNVFFLSFFWITFPVYCTSKCYITSLCEYCLNCQNWYDTGNICNCFQTRWWS